jgi:hypothetical protein
MPSTTAITPQPIPPGHDFPAQRSEIEKWITDGDLAKIRKHAWHIWGGMTADSGEIYDGINLPIWDTWLGNEEVFTKSTPTPLASPARTFQRPAQATHGGSIAAPSQVVSFNKFNPAMASYLAQQHAGPESGSYTYTLASSLAQLNQAFHDSNAKPIDRQVAQATYVAPGSGNQGQAAMETKPVFNLVKATGLTAVPLWRGYSGSAVSSGAITQSRTSPGLFGLHRRARGHTGHRWPGTGELDQLCDSGPDELGTTGHRARAGD